MKKPYEQLIRDVDIVREWTPDIVVLDEAQRIKNWATRTALTVKRLDPPYRLVLTGTPMENRLDELASIVEWVDDLALEPKWRLAAWHTTPVDGKAEIGGARNLETLRSRLATCMVRRVRHEVLRQLPARTDTRIPIEMTAEKMDEHDALHLPIAQILGRAKRRPLAQAEFLRLRSWRSASGGGCSGLRTGRRATCSRARASPRRSSPARRVRSSARRTSWTSTTTLPAACSSPPTPARRPQPAAGRERLHQHRASLESRRARAADRPDPPAWPGPPDRRLQEEIRLGGDDTQ